jgi:hypothetical protein
MSGLSSVIRILVYFNPCGIFICYAILFVVGAEVNVEDSTQRSAFLIPAQNVPGKQEAEGNIDTSRSAVLWSGAACEGFTSYNDNDDNFSHQGNQYYVKIRFPTVIKGEWYYPKRSKLVFSIFCHCELKKFVRFRLSRRQICVLWSSEL